MVRDAGYHGKGWCFIKEGMVQWQGLHEEQNDRNGRGLLCYSRRERHLDFFPGIFWGWCSWWTPECSEIREEWGVRQCWCKSKLMLRIQSCTEKTYLSLCRCQGRWRTRRVGTDLCRGGCAECERSKRHNPGLRWWVEYKKKQRWGEAAQLIECLLSKHKVLGTNYSIPYTGHRGAGLQFKYLGDRGRGIRSPASLWVWDHLGKFTLNLVKMWGSLSLELRCYTSHRCAS